MGTVTEVTPPEELRLPAPPSAEVSRFFPCYILTLKPWAITSLQ